MYSGSATTDSFIAPILDALIGKYRLGSVYCGVNRFVDIGMQYNKTTFTTADFDKIRYDVYFKQYTTPLREVVIVSQKIAYTFDNKVTLTIEKLKKPEGSL